MAYHLTMSDVEQLKLSFLDLETTGLDPEQHEIIEIAVINVKIVPGEDWARSWSENKTVNVKIKPKRPVEPWVARLNGYANALWHCQGIVPAEEALARTYDALENSIIIGSNPAFDKNFLAKAFSDMGWNFPRLKSHHMIDVPSMAARHLMLGRVKSIRQEKVAEVYKIPGDAHRAMGDAEQCMKLYQAILREQSSLMDPIEAELIAVLSTNGEDNWK